MEILLTTMILTMNNKKILNSYMQVVCILLSIFITLFFAEEILALFGLNINTGFYIGFVIAIVFAILDNIHDIKQVYNHLRKFYLL